MYRSSHWSAAAPHRVFLPVPASRETAPVLHDKNNILNINDEENTYYFGINDDYMKNIQAKEIAIKNKLLLDSNKEVIDENNHYLCAWGMTI